MASQQCNPELLERIRLALGLMNEGQYEKIDLSTIETDDGEIASLLKQIMETLNSTSQNMNEDSMDIPIVGQHLTHITTTTESGVLTVLKIAETIMTDVNKVRDILDKLEPKITPNDNDHKLFIDSHQVLDEIQNNCFTIFTSLEFEDINRQLMEKITHRLDILYGNLLDSMIQLKVDTLMERKDSNFLEGLKHIIDLDNSSRQSQEEIDDLFEEFS